MGAHRREDRPASVEPLAGHLVKRSYEEPHWERKRASVVATERVTLYGLPLVAGRKVAYGTIDPELSRSLFIRSALVEGDWDARHAFFAANRQLLDEVERARAPRAPPRHRRLRPGARSSSTTRGFPPRSSRARTSTAGGRTSAGARPDAARPPSRGRRRTTPADAFDRRALPEAWRQGDLDLRSQLPLRSRLRRDGVTVHVPLRAAAAGCEPTGFDWLVPALRLELVTALIRVAAEGPAATARAGARDRRQRSLKRLEPRSEPLLDALARELERLRGVRVPREAFDVDAAAATPAHALPRRGRARRARRRGRRPRRAARAGAAAAACGARGRRLAARAPRPARLDDRNAAAPSHCRARARRYAAIRRWSTRATRVGVRVLETPAAQREAMHAGTRGCSRSPSRRRSAHVQRGLGRAAQLALAGAPHGGVAARARGRDRRRAGRADGGGGRARVGRGRLRARCARTSPAGWPTDRGGRRATSSRILDAAARSSAGWSALAAARALAPARETSSAAAPARASRASSARPARAGWPTSSATCAPRCAGSSGCPTRPRPTATACAPSTSSRPSTRGCSPPGRTGRPLPRALREVPLDARGAARQPLRPGAGDARAGVEQADPACVGARAQVNGSSKGGGFGVPWRSHQRERPSSPGIAPTRGRSPLAPATHRRERPSLPGIAPTHGRSAAPRRERRSVRPMVFTAPRSDRGTSEPAPLMPQLTFSRQPRQPPTAPPHPAAAARPLAPAPRPPRPRRPIATASPPRPPPPRRSRRSRAAWLEPQPCVLQGCGHVVDSVDVLVGDEDRDVDQGACTIPAPTSVDGRRGAARRRSARARALRRARPGPPRRRAPRSPRRAGSPCWCR